MLAVLEKIQVMLVESLRAVVVVLVQRVEEELMEETVQIKTVGEMMKVA